MSGCAGVLAALAVMLLVVQAGISPASANQVVTFGLPSPNVDPLDEPGFQDPDRPSDLRVNVLLPDGYGSPGSEAADYPVLYLLHGANGYHRTWASDLHVDELAADFPGIVVMPDGGVFGMYTDWYNRGAHGKPGWMTYHLDELIAAVHQRYPIRPGRRWHAIAGVSMGGMGAIRYAATRPGYFGNAAAFSGAALNTQLPEAVAAVNVTGAAIGGGATFEDLWGPPNGFYATANNPQELIPNLRETRLFVTSGDGTLCPGDPLDTNPGDMALEAVLRVHADAFVSAARESGIDVTDTHTCGAHSYPTTRRALVQALDWGMFGEVREDPRTWRYITASRRGEMHNGMSFEFGSQPTALITFERSDDTFTAEGEGSVRIRFGDCDVRQSLPFEMSLASCSTVPGPAPVLADRVTPGKLRLARRGRVLKVRSTGTPVRRVRVNVYRLRAKPRRRLVKTRRLGLVGAKNRRLRIKLEKGSRYLVVARGRSAERAVRKTLRFRTR